jgi:hypothetical protein
MGILDDAIREHLDLKRKHGARDAELREIEDEAFGATDQPDPFAAGGELFGDVAVTSTAETGGEEPTRLVEPEALQREPEGAGNGEAPDEAAPVELDLGSFDEPEETSEEEAPIPGQTELPGQDEIPGQERLDEPVEELGESLGQEPAAEPPPPSESLEELIAEEEPFPEDSAAPSPDTVEEPGPSADRGGALEVTELEPEEEGRVPDPPPPPPPGPEPPGRARGRVDVPTQEHPPPGQTGDLPPFPSESAEPSGDQPISDALPLEEAEPAEEPTLESGTPELYDFETDDDPLASGGQQDDDDFEALGPAEEEGPYLDEEEPYGAEDPADAGAPLDEPGTAVQPALEDEEDFEGGELEPEQRIEDDEDDDLWFEKGPPKDFDFDD